MIVLFSYTKSLDVTQEIRNKLLFLQLQLEKNQGGSEDCDAPSSNGDDSEDEDNVRQSPNEDDEAQDSPGPTINAANFDEVLLKINFTLKFYNLYYETL